MQISILLHSYIHVTAVSLQMLYLGQRVWCINGIKRVSNSMHTY